MSQDQASGLLLGLALGDAMGAPFEGGPLERGLWRVLGRTRSGEMRWTDDTQMTLDLAGSFLAMGRIDGDDLARRFARSYRWSRGYGPGAAKLLKSLRRGADWRVANRSVFRDGSFGNGGAMRAPVLALFIRDDREALLRATEEQAVVTHAHPLAIEGAKLVALGVSLAIAGTPSLELLDGLPANHPKFQERLGCARRWLAEREEPKPKEVRRSLGSGISALDSCVTALYLGLRFRDQRFGELVGFASKMGGDVDTICAMAGALWGGVRGAGALPERDLKRLEGRERFVVLARQILR